MYNCVTTYSSYSNIIQTRMVYTDYFKLFGVIGVSGCFKTHKTAPICMYIHYIYTYVRICICTYLLCKNSFLNFPFCMLWNVLQTTASSTLVTMYNPIIRKMRKNNGASGLRLYDSIMTSGKLHTYVHEVTFIYIIYVRTYSV